MTPDDRPLGRCVDDYWPFDAMLDHAQGTRNHRAARNLARNVCRSCELRRTCDDSLAKRGA